jgi:hypothetical protein
MTAEQMDTIAAETKAWVPYEGPRGGEGWRDTDSGRVVYDEDKLPDGAETREAKNERAAELLKEADERTFDEVEEGDVILTRAGDDFAKAEITSKSEREYDEWEKDLYEGEGEKTIGVEYPSGYTSSMQLGGSDTVSVPDADYDDIPHTDESTQPEVEGEAQERIEEIGETINTDPGTEGWVDAFETYIGPSFKDLDFAEAVMSDVRIQDVSDSGGFMGSTWASASGGDIITSGVENASPSVMVHEMNHIIHQRGGYSVDNYSERQEKYQEDTGGDLLMDPDPDELEAAKLTASSTPDNTQDRFGTVDDPWIDDYVDAVNDAFERSVDSSTDAEPPTSYGLVGANEFMTEAAATLNGIRGDAEKFARNHPDVTALYLEKFNPAPGVADTIATELGVDQLPDDERSEAESQTPGGEVFDTFAECTEVNSDKSDPDAYCAAVFGFADESDDDEVEQELVTERETDAMPFGGPVSGPDAGEIRFPDHLVRYEGASVSSDPMVEQAALDTVAETDLDDENVLAIAESYAGGIDTPPESARSVESVLRWVVRVALEDSPDHIRDVLEDIASYGRGVFRREADATTQEAEGPTFAHLSDVTVTRAEMNRIADADDAWSTVSVMGGVGWHNTNTDEVVFASTPEGVPDNYVYVAPDEEVGDEYDTVTSPQGATYRSPSPTDDTDDDTGAATDPDPEEDIDRLRESETATEVITQANDEPFGGFTFQRNLEVQALGERDEWAVGLGLGPGRQQEEMDKDDIQEVYEEHLELLEDFTGLRIGGYHFGDDDGGYEIEVSVTLNDADEAEALGEELNQDSVFNLGTEELIMTGGDGDSPIESIDDARDVLETIDSITEMAFSVVTDSADEIDSMAAQTEMDTTTVYANDAGDELTFAQIARAAAKQPELEVEEADDGDGYIFDGELYTPVADEDGVEE